MNDGSAEVRNLTVKFGSLVVNHDVSFDVKKAPLLAS